LRSILILARDLQFSPSNLTCPDIGEYSTGARLNLIGEHNMTLQKKAQQGFTLIELMIVIAIVGILAAIALPAYQDYITRSKLSEATAALAEAKTTVAEYYAANGKLPTDLTVYGINTAVRNSIVLSNLDIVGTAATVSIYALVYASTWNKANYGHFALSGDTNSDGTITWTCLPGSATMASQTSTPVPSKYLPANCRG
jgi:type IV pilus assembly protein PilA